VMILYVRTKKKSCEEDMTTRERVRENKVEKECVQVVNWYRTEKHIDVRQLLNIGVIKNNDHLYHIHI